MRILGGGRIRETHHVPQYILELRQTGSMVFPDLLERLEKCCSFLAFLHRVFGDIGGEGRNNVFPRKLVEILRHKLGRAFVEALAILVKDHVICVPVVLLKGKICGTVVLDLDNIVR